MTGSSSLRWRAARWALAPVWQARVLALMAWALAGGLPSPAMAQQAVPGAPPSPDGLWQRATDQNLQPAQRRADVAGYVTVQLNRTALDGLLAQAPLEIAGAARTLSPVVVTLPLVDGTYARFRIEESPILAPELAAAFPQIKTYRGAGVDDPAASARLDLTDRGFHAMIVAPSGTTYVDPYAPGDLVNHVVYDKGSRTGPGGAPDIVIENPGDAALRSYNAFPITNGTNLRTYRLALAATYEYTAAAGGTKSAALSRMTTSMNRVNGIYERELAVRLTLATGTPADPTAIIYDIPQGSPGGSPYTNSSGSTMLGQNQSNLTSVIGSANYDIGHVFSTGGGGIAVLGSVCSAGSKAQGVTGLPNPVGDAFDVDYVAHEMGHQFGGNHTFNGTTSNCQSPNRSSSHAYEVGSGSTIQAYAGICGGEDLQLHSDDFFTFESLNEMTAFITSGGGVTCGTPSGTGNTVPSVSGPGGSFTVPGSTPFALTASGSDVDGDTVTYLWEEHDLGTASSSVATASTDDGSRPLFRSYTPTTSPTRTFPALTYVLNNQNVPPQTYACGASSCLTGEVLPSTNRTMTFMVTARDNRSGGGGISTDQTQVVVNGSIGPFTVTAPNTSTSWPAGSVQTVTWNVNGANTLAANVNILLSTDGGLTYPITLLASTPNDGSQNVTVANTSTSTARVKVEAAGNIFFDVSNVNFSIFSCSYSLSPASPVAVGGGASTGTLTVTATSGCAWSASSTNPGMLTLTGATGGTGNGTVPYSVSANAGGARAATITITGNAPFTGSFVINQAAGCTYSLSPTAAAFGAAGGSGSVGVTATNGCSWSVSGLPAWASTTSGGSGTGSGTWQYTVQANGGGARSQTVTVAGQSFALSQLASGTNPRVVPPGRSAVVTLTNSGSTSLSTFEAVAARSYCAEVAPGPLETTRATPTLTVLRSDMTTTLAGGTAGATRACFVAPQGETLFVRVAQADASARTYRLRVVESTLWANWFFTGGGYASYTLLRNTTAASVTATITWRDASGSVLGAPVTLALAPGAVAIYDAASQAGSNQSGSVDIAHSGEPQGIAASQSTLAPATGLSFDTLAFQRISW